MILACSCCHNILVAIKFVVSVTFFIQCLAYNRFICAVWPLRPSSSSRGDERFHVQVAMRKQRLLKKGYFNNFYHVRNLIL